MEQVETWPPNGRHILAQYDKESIVVYQAYRPEIGLFAAQNGHFGGAFSYNRMSWIKPNFLWMMYRSGWGAKEGQEVILAVRLSRTFFDDCLEKAVPSSFDSTRFESRTAWADAVQNSEVRLQWDPDHDPVGNKQERRAIQLGLRGEMLRRYGQECLSITDISTFVQSQRPNATPPYTHLLTPKEAVYLPQSPAAWMDL